METRAKLSSQLATMEAATSREEEAVAKMNEEKMIRALNSNVKLGCLQSVFDKVVMVTAFDLETNLCEAQRGRKGFRLITLSECCCGTKSQ